MYFEDTCLEAVYTTWIATVVQVAVVIFVVTAVDLTFP
jgi:hypothetical protein